MSMDDSPTLNTLLAELKEHADNGIMRVGKDDGTALVVVVCGPLLVNIVDNLMESLEGKLSEMMGGPDNQVSYTREFHDPE